MAYLTAYLLYNVTEGAFKALNFLFVIFLVIAIEYPMARAGANAGFVRQSRMAVRS